MKTGADPFSKEKRAAVMRAVKSKDTKPELEVRSVLRELGFARRYRLGGAGLPGKPDIVLGPVRKAIFVHGCFWHGHNCARGARAPKANAAYWTGKIARNRVRDAAAAEALGAMQWSALTVWECELKDKAALSQKLSAFLGASG
jgi:DNA mismatch endonuclease (patch repair protein)